MRTRFAILAGWMVIVAGCGLTEPMDDGSKPLPTPDNNTTIKSPAESYWKGYAVAVERRQLLTPRDIANNVLILKRWGQLSDSDIATFESAFPQAVKNTTPFDDPKAAAQRLRSLK